MKHLIVQMRKKVVQMSKLQLSSSYPKNIFQKSKKIVQMSKNKNSDEPKNNSNKPKIVQMSKKNSSNDRKDSSNEHTKQ